MITGDHIEAALHVAKAAGIINEEEAEYEGIYLTGEQFRNPQLIGEYSFQYDNEKKKHEIKFYDLNRFKNVKARLRIIARATADDKLLLVSGIKQAGGLVAMSGESIADARALKEADVGLCMGTGCQVAKDNADLIILDNQFGSIYRAIRWGRAIFDNVRKFIQFQMTLNLVLCTSVLVIGTTLGASPFKVIHLLWANLVMDVLGAIALGTEPPSTTIKEVHVDKKESGSTEIPTSQANRVSRKDRIIIPSMWRTIFTQAIYQLLVIFTLQYFGTYMFFDESYNLVTDYDNMESGHVVNTMIFHTFMLMNLVNMINCRVVQEEEMNVFKTLLNNITFWAIIGIEMAIQMLFMYGSDFGGQLLTEVMGCAELNQTQRIVCWSLALVPLFIFPLSKLIPMKFFNNPKFKSFVELEVSREESAIS